MTTREQWLGGMVDALRPAFDGIGYPLPERIRVSCGWPSRSGLSSKSKRIGEAWSPKASADGTHETFLSPCLGTAEEVGHVLAHELVHHAVGVECGHRGAFRKCALAIGLQGKMTATTASRGLQERLNALASPLGPYPHATLSGSSKPKQTTRMLKVTCSECGCVVRMAKKWLDDTGAPTCACGGEMTTDSKGE